MAFFSESDINEAKRRVREMQSRANHYVNDEKQERESAFTPPPISRNERNQAKNDDTKAANNRENEKGSILDFLGDGDKSQIIILALILILSREGADNKLIMALIYLLL